MLQLSQRAVTCVIPFVLCALFITVPVTKSFAQGSPAGVAGPDAGSLAPIGPNDSLNVTVIGEPDLTGSYVVDTNGDISLPYAGKIHVGSLSIDDAATLIQSKLAQIYTNPQVTVVRPTLGGITINVTGAVAKQGENQLRRDAHLNDVIQLCAPLPDADLTHIAITSGLPGQPHTTNQYDLTTFLGAGSDSGNPALNDGDQIFVPRKTTESVSVIGYVAKPGRYDVLPGETVFQLVQDAGGLLPSADPDTTYLKQIGSDVNVPFNYISAAQDPGNPDVNPVVRDGDEIVVPLAANLPSYAMLGAFIKPGEYPLRGRVTLLDAIALAGGLEDRAQSKKTTITRQTPKGPTVLTLDSADTKKTSLFLLQPGDNISVPHGASPSPYNVFSMLGLLGTVVALTARH